MLLNDSSLVYFVNNITGDKMDTFFLFEITIMTMQQKIWDIILINAIKSITKMLPFHHFFVPSFLLISSFLFLYLLLQCNRSQSSFLSLLNIH